MTDNVTPFPGMNMKQSQKAVNNASKGKKITQQQALGALIENGQKLEGLQNAVARLAQAMNTFENELRQMGTTHSVLMKALVDNGTLTDEMWEAAWDKYVVKPNEEALTKHLEQLKQGSAEDAYYVEVINMVRAHKWPDREVEGDKYTGEQIQNFYIRTLLDPAVRARCLQDVRKELPDIPELKIEQEQVRSSEERKMPDCKYCGEDDCELCNPKEISPSSPAESEVD